MIIVYIHGIFLQHSVLYIIHIYGTIQMTLHYINIPPMHPHIYHPHPIIHPCNISCNMHEGELGFSCCCCCGITRCCFLPSLPCTLLPLPPSVDWGLLLLLACFSLPCWVLGGGKAIPNPGVTGSQQACPAGTSVIPPHRHHDRWQLDHGPSLPGIPCSVPPG